MSLFHQHETIQEGVPKFLPCDDVYNVNLANFSFVLTFQPPTTTKVGEKSN